MTDHKRSIRRKYFKKFHQTVPLQDLINIQIFSYSWFLKEGLKELFEEISPIEDASGRELELHFSDHYLDEPRFDEKTAKSKNLTYEAALRVQAQLINERTGEIKEQEVYLGDFPLMTERGTFIVNGIERVVVSQLIRSAGVFFTSELIKGKNRYGAKIIPNRGAWLELETDSSNVISVKIDRKRKVAVTALLRAFGYSSNEEIIDLFKEVDANPDIRYIEATISKDVSRSEAEGLKEIYKRIRPGDMATVDNARSLIHSMFFNFDRYDFGKVGRYKLNQRFGFNFPLTKENRILKREDLVAIVKDIIRLNNTQDEADDIDHLGNRRVRAIGELVQNKFRVGLARMERIVKDRMSTKDIATLTPNQLTNARPVIGAVKEFFMSSQLSQFMDQTNPLAELEHKRRLSAMGPGGLSRERAGFDVRDVHRTHYGRICPISTPEGPNIGLVGHLTTYARINEYGFIESPFRKVLHDLENKATLTEGKIARENIKDEKTDQVIIKADETIDQKKAKDLEKANVQSIPIKPLVTDEIVYLDAFEEEKCTTTAATTPIDDQGYFIEEKAEVRRHDRPAIGYTWKIDYMDVAPCQIVSVATSLIPFLEHDDAVRALMGTNMQRQAVSCITPEAPLIGTGVETQAARDSGQVTIAKRSGKVIEVSASAVKILEDSGNLETYSLGKFIRSNASTCMNQKPIVDKGEKVEGGQVIADGASTDRGELALGQNILIAFMPWEGGNYEDAILISEKLVREDRYSSIHIEDYKIDVRDTKLGPEIVTRDIPNVSEEKLKDLDQEGIVRIGANVSSGDILVGKITPKGETELSAEEKLLRAIFGEKAKDVKDSSLYLEHGEHGKVVGIKIFSREKGDRLPSGVTRTIQVSVAQLRKIQVGDKMAGRHGNKGVISRVVAVEDMPFLEDGTPVDIILNPLGVASRMNLGQILETHLGLAAKKLDYYVASPALDGISESTIREELKKAKYPEDGKIVLYDGRSGKPFDKKVTVGYIYMMKLNHLVEDKIHQRSIGPYSLVTQQPLGGKAQFGGQRFGEMEVWALEAYGSAHTLQEMLTIKSDDVPGRSKAYEAVIKGEPIRKLNVPESFNVLVRELKGLGLNVELLEGKEKSGKVEQKPIKKGKYKKSESAKKETPLNFEAIRLKLASPDEIHNWSHGEVIKPETINYRTQKPEKDGLFCEKIFGPSKDWECYCGKYKRIRYKGIICDKCGVEVTRSLVRRERMGHIDLAVPVSHIWFLRGVPSKIGLILDLSVQNLEKVIYFANFIVTEVSENLRQETLKQIDEEYRNKKKAIEADFNRRLNEIKNDQNQSREKSGTKKKEKAVEQELINNAVNRDEKLRDLQEAVDLARKELKELRPLQIISENKYQDLSLKYGHVFEAGIGAETIRKLLEKIDPDKLIKELEEEVQESSKNQRRRMVRRLKLVKNMKKNSIQPEWMILTAIPVIPPDLRPMVQLDGGRFAASDLNDLYRRVINRNNRLKRLLELNAPEVICRNEKRMLQEAVDALIDNNARHGKTVTASTGQRRQLKSLADMLKGKQGRFRQNLLGKRVDYSGRSVIVVGPHLKLNQCGIPKRMALELFKPFVISELIKKEYVHNVRSANRFIDSGRPEVWDILEEVTRNSHVLLNRAPTLHRLGIQAFQPILIEGSAIQIHPLVCPPFNADFDGDQMAVHVPLTQKAKWEAKEIMLSTKNLLKPATGEPVVTPSQDIVLGCYYLTLLNDEDDIVKKIFSSPAEAILAYEREDIRIQSKIKIRQRGKVIETNIGRVLFNEVLPDNMPFYNQVMDKKTLKSIIRDVLNKEGNEKTAELLDQIKRMSLKYLTQSGLSWGMGDTPIPPTKKELIKKAEQEIDEVQNQYETGLLTKEERRARTIDIWASVKSEIQEISKGTLDRFGPVFAMIDSGSRGTWGQITQMMGMKGLVTNPAGETIELPVKGSFKEGFDVLEYFISTHGTRKGLSDTALRTANAGYLTRRLVDVAQDVVITEEDCKDKEGILLTKEESEEIGDTIANRILGRVVLEDIKSGKKTIAKKGQLITEKEYEQIKDPEQVRIRSILTCRTLRGICQKCYGYELGYNRLVELGGSVGIIAAQSIGEPGTQLTMRTFHTGGVAGQDITQGLPRVEELFEARPVKKAAIVSEIDGQVTIVEENKQKVIKVHSEQPSSDNYDLDKIFKKKKYIVKVKKGQLVKEGDVLAEGTNKIIKAKEAGRVNIKEQTIKIEGTKEEVKEYPVPLGYSTWVKEGDLVTRGQQLTEGSLNLAELYRFKGKIAVQKYIISEIQYIYSSQGQRLNDKHVEIIVRQMFSRFYIKDAGDTNLLSGEIVSEAQLHEANKSVKKGGQKAVAENLLLGITKASLSTESFLAAASFQETARVLIDAAVSGKVDRLTGLKENVIIGKLIPVGTGFSKE